MAPTEIVDIATPEGPGRLFVDHASDAVTHRGTVVLGHGAGGGVTARDLEVLARRLPAGGITVARFEQPWRTAGGRVAVRPPRLDVAWLAMIQQLVAWPWFRPPLVAGGRSAGARVACRTAVHLEVAAVVCLAFPLHLPGRPEQSRAAELAAPKVPRLVLQGTKDTFGNPAEIRAALSPEDLAAVTIVELPGADHSFRLPKGSVFSSAELFGLVASSTTALVQAVADAHQHGQRPRKHPEEARE